jgi:hypothetical protein
MALRLPAPSNLPTLRAAWWTLRAVRKAKRQLRNGRDYRDLAVPAPPRLVDSAERGVTAVLRRSRSSCLVQATVRQSWEVGRGRRRDLIIGVTPPSEGFRAHAWLEGDPESSSAGFSELARKPAA